MNLPKQSLENHIAILGKTGSGKTSTAKLVVERVVAEGARVCVLDPIKSDWWGMTSSADGKHAGLPFHILGGPHGHVPLHSSAGAAIGEIVATGALPLSILDMSDFEAGGLQRFFVDFAPALLRRMRGVVYLVLEEAHEFAPKERAGFGGENMMVHFAKKLASAGRSKGIRMILATQRTQSLHNALLGSCETMIVHRLTAPADQKPVLNWLKANAPDGIMKTVEDELASLPTGTGWLGSGEARVFERVRFPRIHTYDNSASPTADSGDHKVTTAPVDQEKLRSIIGDAVKEAEANDPKKLKEHIAAFEKQIANLKRELAAKPVPVAAPVVDEDAIAEKAFKVGFEEGQAAAWRKAAELFDEWANSVLAAVGSKPAFPVIAVPTARVAPQTRALVRPVHHTAPAARRAPAQATANGAAVSLGAERKPLALLAVAYPAGYTEAQWATLAGFKRTGGTWSTYKSRLRSQGLIEQVGGLWFATPLGVDAVGETPIDLPTSPRGRLDMWKGKIAAVGPMLDALYAAYPQAIDREQLAEHIGMTPTGGSFNTYLSRLRSNGLLEEPERGLVRLSAAIMGDA